MNNYKLITETIQADRPLLLYGTDREYLAQLYPKMGYTVGAEIGVGGGVFAALMFKHNPDLKLYCVDAWQVYDGYIDFTSQDGLEKDYQAAQHRLHDKNAIFVREFSLDAAKLIPDGSLDYVYIDACHEAPHVGNDIAAWVPKVRPGGMVSGHDYIYPHRAVMMAVDAWVAEHDCGPLFLVGDPCTSGEEMVIMSWFWVQP
jgi:hypothetical protein